MDLAGHLAVDSRGGGTSGAARAGHQKGRRDLAGARWGVVGLWGKFGEGPRRHKGTKLIDIVRRTLCKDKAKVWKTNSYLFGALAPELAAIAR